jgi:iron-sulfur cluster assembly protein
MIIFLTAQVNIHVVLPKTKLPKTALFAAKRDFQNSEAHPDQALKLTSFCKSDNIGQNLKPTKEKIMLQEVQVTPFTLTPAASQAIKNILEERKLEGYALRVYVAGGGCSGVSFGMALDNNVRDVDTSFDTDGVKVVVDNISIDYLREAVIDFVNDPQRGPGFAVHSPHAQAKGSCGCGSNSEGDSCCSSGDSCGCGS